MAAIDAQLQRLVRTRAGDRCEYCLLPQSVRRFRFQIDHVQPQQHGGPTTESNLALCCGRCNRHKGPNLTGVDPVSGQLARLDDPRSDRWPEHFHWDGPLLVGDTPTGRVTVYVLAMNHPDDLATRAELATRGQWPPSP